MQSTALLSAEWQTLQNQQERYEHSALTIKLTGLALAVLGLATGLSSGAICAVIALLWVQEGIFKTFQNRLTRRLLSVESLLRLPAEAPSQAMQLHSEWLAGRPGGLALIGEYLTSARRPTVVFPYLPLIMIVILARIAG